MSYTEQRDKEVAKKAKLKSEIDAILSDETREYGPDDQKKVEELMAKVDQISAKLDAMTEMEKVEEEVEEDSVRSAPAVIRSRGRVSAGNIHEHAHREGYSISRASVDFVERGRLTGIEAEVDQELRRSGGCNGSFKMPADFNRLNQRDLTLTTGAGSVPIYWDGFIDYLYPKMVGPQLGFKYMTGLAGVTKIPRQSSVPTVQAVAEQGAATGSQPGLDNVTLTPRTLTANVNISRKFAQQSVVAADRFVMDAGSTQVAVQLDQWAITGSGASNQPYGLLNNAAFTQLQVAASNVAAYSDVLALQQKVAEANANFGDKLKFLTSPYGHAKLQQTPKLGTTFPEFIIKDHAIDGDPVIKSSQVPKNLTYSASSNLTALIYGNWEFLVVATFGNGLDVIVDPYTGSTKGDLQITFLLDADTNLMQPTAFAAIPNIA